MREYIQVRGAQTPAAPFFRSRFGRALSRGTLYERIRTLGRRARLTQRLSPHKLRHTFASHLVREGINLVTIRDLLGHRMITSTQIYLHVTAHDLRKAADGVYRAAETARSATTLPSTSVTMRSQRLAKSILCVTSNTVVPLAALTRRSNSNTLLADCVSRFPVGSSARIRRGFRARALAIATRCC